MRLPQLTLRELFLLVALVAMGCGWWVDRSRIEEARDTERRMGPFMLGDTNFPVLSADETMEAIVKDANTTLVVRIKKAGRTISEQEFENPYAPFVCGTPSATSNP